MQKHKFRTGEMPQSIKCLLHKLENPSSDPQTPHRKLNLWVWCHASVCDDTKKKHFSLKNNYIFKDKDCKKPGFVLRPHIVLNIWCCRVELSQLSQTNEGQDSVRDPISKDKVESDREDTTSTSASTYISTHVCTQIHQHVHTLHTQKPRKQHKQRKQK